MLSCLVINYVSRFDYECSADGLDRLVDLALKHGALGSTFFY